MDTFRQSIALVFLLAGSVAASLLVVAGVDFPTASLKWAIYLPFYVTLLIYSIAWKITMYKVETALLFLAGTVFTALYLIFLVEKMPRTISHKVLGLFFSILLLIVGRSVFLGLIFLPQLSFSAAVHSLKVFGEFLIMLVLLHILLRNDAFSVE